MKKEIILKFSACINGVDYRAASLTSKIPRSTICDALKKRTASEKTIVKMVRYLGKVGQK